MSNGNIIAALDAAANGWYVWPSKPGHRGYVKWSTEASNDPAQVMAWAEKWPDAYYCIACGPSDLMVLDLDQKNGKDGVQSALHAGLKLPPTFRVRTPSGGEHWYYRGAGATTAGVLGEGIDTRGIGGMVPVPGAVVPGKGTYKVIDDRPPAPTPNWPLKKPDERPPDRRELVEPDLPENIAAAKDYLQTAEPAIEGAGGNAATYRVFCQLRDWGLSKLTALELADDEWNNRCSPPWEYFELAGVAENAYRYARKPAGNATPEGGAVLAAEKFEADNPYRAHLLRDFIYEVPPPRRWIIDQWLPWGASAPTLITGDGGVGKSLACLQLAISVASGRPWFGLPVCESLPVIIFSCEDDMTELHRRLYRILTRLGESPKAFDDRIAVVPIVGTDAVIARATPSAVVETEVRAQLLKTIEGLGWGDQLIMWDTVTDFHSVQESDRTAVNQLLKRHFCSFAQEAGATSMLIAHPPKTGASYSGSTNWNGSVRNRLFMEAVASDPTGATVKLQKQKANFAAKAEITLRYADGIHEVVDTGALAEACRENVYADLVAACNNNLPVSLSPSAPRALARTRFLDAGGRAYAPDVVQIAVDELLLAGRLEYRTGRRSGGNGLFPAGWEA